MARGTEIGALTCGAEIVDLDDLLGTLTLVRCTVRFLTRNDLQCADRSLNIFCIRSKAFKRSSRSDFVKEKFSSSQSDSSESEP